MKIVYSDQELPYQFDCFGYDFSGTPLTMLSDDYKNGIMLCGPTPRNDNVESWRIGAIELLKKNKFNGTVFIPERTDWQTKFDYLDQVEWELDVLTDVKTILFWIPRDLKTMPALTTNVEFGLIVKDLNINMIYGRPDDAPKNRYLDFLFKKYRPNNKTYNDLQTMIEEYV